MGFPLLSWRNNRSDIPNEVDQGESSDMKLEVLYRDKLICCECSFESKYSKQVPAACMEVRPDDQDYTCRDSSRWSTVCPFCHAVSNAVEALQNGKYILIAAPWISQSELFSLIRPILSILIDKDHLYYTEAFKIYKMLQSFEQSVPSVITHIPDSEDTLSKNIARFLFLLDSTITDEQYSNRGYFVHGLRLFPVNGQFDNEAVYWHEGIFKHYPLSKWERLVSWKKEV